MADQVIFGVNLINNENEKITVFVNHWPSRSGGQIESEPNRISAAQTLTKMLWIEFFILTRMQKFLLLEILMMIR